MATRRSSAAPLAAYRSRRDFAKTPEPTPDPARHRAATPPDRFVIQKHFARRLHFDLRLEIAGVATSWAVTKGPSLDPKVRRLAVRTEDHPLDYMSFEGTIPTGQYGAGEVEIWDRGTFTLLADVSPAEALEQGHLKFRLDGERLRGGFALVRTRPEKGREQWLLIKEKDEAATNAFDPIKTWIGSVDGPHADGPPAFLKPQLATEVDRPPSGDDWVHEIKYDGYRLQAVKAADRVRLFTRSGHDWAAKLPHIAGAVRALPRNWIHFDGELVVFDADANSDFKALQGALEAAPKRIVYVVFDCLQIDRRDLKPRPWAVRNGELRALIAGAPPPLKVVEHLTGDGPTILDAAVKLGAEGIVSKHRARPWKCGRNRHWLKTKGERRATFAVGGYRKSKARPFASLILGEPGSDGLLYAGRVGTGFSDRDLAALSDELARLETSSPPFECLPDAVRRDAVWTTPELHVQVAYRERTRDGYLRHPRFIRRAPGPPSPAPADGHPSTTRIQFTNTDRVVFPAAGITKGDVLDYMAAAAPHMLPHVAGRFVSLVRAPAGDLTKTFFQRHAFNGMPDTIQALPAAGRAKRYLAIDSAAGLAAAAQFGALEFHPWGAKRATPTFPDRLVLDLDPADDVPFAHLKAAARLVRDVLAAGGVTSFPMLTGGKGIHVIAPLDESRPWSEVTAFAKALAVRLARAEPGRFIAKATKASRKGRIYIDWQRNAETATAVAPWSPRARPGAPVACPVAWDELSRQDSAAAYDLARARRRLAALRHDPWEGYFDLRQTVPDLPP